MSVRRASPAAQYGTASQVRAATLDVGLFGAISGAMEREASAMKHSEAW